MEAFKKELIKLISKYNINLEMDISDHALADYMIDCLSALDNAISFLNVSSEN